MRIKTYLTSVCLYFFVLTAINSQTTQYNGPDGGDWLTASNWTAGLPSAGNNALIGGGINVVINAPLTIDFTITNFGGVTASAPLTNNGTISNSGSFNFSSTSGLINNATFNNFSSSTIGGPATFVNETGATFTNVGTFTVSTILTNRGLVTNNGTINATAGTLITEGSFDNSQTLTTESLTVAAGSTFTNNFGSFLFVTGPAALLQVNGNFNNLGNVEAGGTFNVTGNFSNSSLVLVSNSLTISSGAIFNNAGGTVSNEGIAQNSGTFINGYQFINKGSFSNDGVFNNNNLIDNQLGSFFSSSLGATIGMGFGSKIQNAGTFTTNGALDSFGNIENSDSFTNGGTINSFSGSQINNLAGSFTNNGTISTNDKVINDAAFFNSGLINVNGGSVWKNNASFTNNTSGQVKNVQDFQNLTTGVLTNNGRFTNLVRTLNEGTFTNNAYLENMGIFTNSKGAELNNNEHLQQSSGNLLNNGTLNNTNLFLSDECSSISNDGSVNNSGKLEVHALLFQRGAMTGTAVDCQSCYVHNSMTSDAPAICQNASFGTDINGDVKVYATALIAFENFDSCSNLVYLANGIARPVFACSDIGTTINVHVVVHVPNTSDSLSCTAIVTPKDELEPQIDNCPKDIVIFTDQAGVAVDWTEPAFLDNCSASTVVASHTPGEVFPIGISGVTYTGTDDYGNANNCQFRVDVRQTPSGGFCAGDLTGPSFVGCPNDITLVTTGSSTNASWVAPTATDNCYPIFIHTDFVPGQNFGIGTTTVTYFAIDGGANESTCTFDVTVNFEDPCAVDNTPPSFINCPANIYKPTNTVTGGAVAVWASPNVFDLCGVVSINSSHLSGSVFSAGTTNVVYTAEDVNGNTSTCNFTITVGNDPCPDFNTPPVFTNCPTDIAVQANGNSAAVSWTAPTANSACQPISISSNYTPGAVFQIGQTAVTYQASDVKGNTSTCSFRVSVLGSCTNDNEPPIIANCPTNITVPANNGIGIATWSAPTATDNCGLVTFSSTYLPGALFPLGVTTVIYTAGDMSGNGSTCAFNVAVVGVPECTTNAAPINLTTNVDPVSVALSWNSSLNASAYDVFLGTTNPPTQLAVTNVSGTSTIISGLQSGTTYYWYTVPKNAAGSATGCSSNATSFSTIVGGGGDCLSDLKTVSVRVSSGNDDAEERLSSGSVSTGSTDLELGQDGSNKQIVGMRFRSLGIPKGSAISSAYIEFETDETNSSITSVVINGQAIDDAPGFSSTYYSISSRAKTNATVQWNNIPSWNNISQKHQSPDIGSILQEIIDRNGWSSGNDVVIMIEGSGERTAESYNGESSNAPLLVVEFAEQLSLPPTAVCKNVSLQQSSAGQTVTVTPQDVDGGSLANCGTITNRTVSPNSFSQPGIYPVNLTVTNSLGLSATCSASVTVNGPACSGAITGLSFYNLNNGTTFPLIDGGIYALSDLPSSYNILASTAGDFESVNFKVSGAITDSHTENVKPYHYSGDTNPLDLIAGDYTMIVTVYSQNQSAGDVCDQVTYHFTLTDTPPCNPIILVCESYINNNGWVNHNDCRVVVCQGDQLTLSVNPNGAQFSSMFGPNGYNATSSGGNDFFISGNVNQSNAGDYYVDLIDGNGCKGSTIITVVVEGAPVAVCKDITLQLQSIGQSVQIDGHKIDGGSTGGCGTILTYNASPTSFSQPGIFPVKLTVTNSLGLSSSCDATITVLAPEDGGSDGPCVGNQGTGLLREIWYGITEYDIACLTSKSSYPNNPDGTYINASSTGPSNFGNNYGTRVRGFITPSSSGNYTFYVTGDDQTALYLSTDTNPNNMNKIASVSGWTNENEFYKYSSQKSASIYLLSGKSYYVELLHVEIGGGDHWGIHWVKPGSTSPVAIPLQYLSPFDPGCNSSGNPILQNGKIVIEQASSNSWYWVNFEHPFSEAPVVILGPPSANSTEQVIPRLRNVTKTGFEFQLDEWNYLNGYHPKEILYYLAMIPGNHNVDGFAIEAGSFTANDNWATKYFNQPFASTPLVLTTVGSYNDANAVTPRTKNVAKNSFQFKLQEENNSSHANEKINYIAMKTGSFNYGGANFKSGITANSVTDNWYSVSFGNTFSDPGFLASFHTYNGSDVCAIRHKDLTATNVNIKVEEEQSQDWETSHPSEEIGWLVFSTSTTLNLTASVQEDIQLEAVKEEEFAILYWTHNKGQNVSEYVLEKSGDGNQFFSIATIESEGVNRPTLYENYDLAPAVGENLYRVKLVHLDGTVSYSAIASIFYRDLIDFILFPNPANDFVKLNLEAIVGMKDINVAIYNNLGVLVRRVEIDQVYSKYYQLDLREMKEGHYILWLNMPGRKALAKQLVIGKM